MRTLLLLVSQLFLSAQLLAQCEITNLVAEPHPCINGMFLVDIDFDVINPEGDTFGIVGNATIYGEFAYDSLPVTLGPLPGDGVTEWEFIVFDVEEPNCQATFVLGTVDCCAITDVVVDPTECDNLETFSAVVNFNFMNTGNVGFDVFDANENPLGFFSYGDLPVTVSGIPSVGNGNTTITICDNDNPDCCTTVEFPGLDCDPNDCEIWNVDVIASDCENGDFFVTLGFNFENVGPGFTVQGNGNNYGAFSYDSLPITIGPLLGDSVTIYEFIITDVQNGDCSDFGVIGPINCPPGCFFDEIIIDPITCQGDSNYSLAINFVPGNNGPQGFNVTTNGVFLGSFEYTDLPVVIDSFPASGEFFDVITLCDNIDTSCCVTVEFQALLCGECLIYDMVAEPSACDTNGQFTVTIDFEFQNVGNSGFTVGGNGNNYGNFEYADLPITIGPFDGDSTTFYEFVVLDLENGLCLAGVELGTVDCISPCTIGELIVDPLECTGNGEYALFLDFEYVNTSNVGFDVYANGEFLGFFLYDELPVTILNFPSSGNVNDLIEVCDNDNPDCCSLLEFPGLACMDTCAIFEVIVDLDECTSDSTFGLFVNFETTGFTAGGVDVWAGDDYLGFFATDTLPIYVPNFPSSGNVVDMTICESDNPDCCITVEFETLNCAPMCSIFDVVIDPVECDSTGSFSAFVNFESTGLTNGFVDIWVNDLFLGFYPADSTPILVTGIPGSGQNALLTVCENDNPDCCGLLEFETLNCNTPCSISNIIVESLGCDTITGTFDAEISFTAEGLTNDFVEIWIDEEYYGFFAWDTLPIVVEGIPGDGTGSLITICENDNPDCCASEEFLTPDCGGAACAIFDIGIDLTPCDSNTFGLTVDFESEGLTSNFVDVWVNDLALGTFPVDSFPISVAGIPGTGANAVLTICDSENIECCGVLEFETPDCGISDCVISDIVVETIECDSSTGTFTAVITFNHDGLTNDFVEVWINEEYYGFHPWDSLPIIVDGVPGNGAGALITICENDNPACCATDEFLTPDCGTAMCAIFDVGVDPLECTSDSTFAALVSFETEGFTNSSVDIWAGDTFLGFYSVDSMPILLTNIPTTLGNVVLTICENDNPACCTQFEFASLECGPECAIGPVEATLSDCDSAGQFFVTLDFDVVNGDPGGFTVLGNGNNYGSFSYDDVPVTVGPLAGDSTTVYEFIVVDNGTPNCSNFTEVGIVGCETTGLFGPVPDVAQLEIFYSGRNPWFVVPEQGAHLSLWSLDGRQVMQANDLPVQDVIFLKADPGAPGLYLVRVTGIRQVYVAKVFLAE